MKPNWGTIVIENKRAKEIWSEFSDKNKSKIGELLEIVLAYQIENNYDPKKCICGKEGLLRTDNGLKAGVHCDECWDRIVSECRCRSW